MFQNFDFEGVLGPLSQGMGWKLGANLGAASPSPKLLPL
jgi:hypothetical protein